MMFTEWDRVFSVGSELYAVVNDDFYKQDSCGSFILAGKIPRDWKKIEISDSKLIANGKSVMAKKRAFEKGTFTDPNFSSALDQARRDLGRDIIDVIRKEKGKE